MKTLWDETAAVAAQLCEWQPLDCPLHEGGLYPSEHLNRDVCAGPDSGTVHSETSEREAAGRGGGRSVSLPIHTCLPGGHVWSGNNRIQVK